MRKEVIIDTIGKIFVEKDFRDKFIVNPVRTIEDVSDLSNMERKYLKEMSAKISECTSGLGTVYEGQKKRK